MTTKIRRGRDPEQHEVHVGIKEANLYTGVFGQLTLVADGADQGADLIEIRVHNGVRRGGFAIQLEPAVGGKTGSLARVQNVTIELAEEGPTYVQHELGYQPTVSVMDSEGNIVNAAVKHVDEENLELTVTDDLSATSQPTSVTLILR